LKPSDISEEQMQRLLSCATGLSTRGGIRWQRTTHW